jgi:hypothetical protein
MKQYVITPAAGKRLIGKALAGHPIIRKVLSSGTLTIIAGTTNGFIAEEILKVIGDTSAFNRSRFIRGITLPPGRPAASSGHLPDEKSFPGDMVLVKGAWQKGKTIFDVAESLKEGDVILKGANAVDLIRKRAAVLIGHPKGGTLGLSIQAVIGRRVQLILPVGLEKRISGNLDELAAKMNQPGSDGMRFMPAPGMIFTELEAITHLTGAAAELIAGGGVGGAEGCVWVAVSGTEDQLARADKIVKPLLSEPAFEL